MSSAMLVGIGEAARQTGLEPSAIRYYEDAWLVDPPKRVSVRRQYGAANLDQLRVVDEPQLFDHVG